MRLISTLAIGAMVAFGSMTFACPEHADGKAAQAVEKASPAAQLVAQASTPTGRFCRSTSDCLATENCINGECRAVGGGGSCISDIDCPLGERCVVGRCVR